IAYHRCGRAVQSFEKEVVQRNARPADIDGARRYFPVWRRRRGATARGTQAPPAARTTTTTTATGTIERFLVAGPGRVAEMRWVRPADVSSSWVFPSGSAWPPRVCGTLLVAPRASPETDATSSANFATVW